LAERRFAPSDSWLELRAAGEVTAAELVDRVEPDTACAWLRRLETLPHDARRAHRAVFGSAPVPRERVLVDLERALRNGRVVALAIERHDPIPVIESFDEVQPVAPQRTWIAMLVVDRGGRPVRGLGYRITLPDGQVRHGSTDRDGAARVEGIPPGSCSFELPGLDAGDWKYLG
jgi:hypothetical protein